MAALCRAEPCRVREGTEEGEMHARLAQGSPLVHSGRKGQRWPPPQDGLEAWDHWAWASGKAAVWWGEGVGVPDLAGRLVLLDVTHSDELLT